MNARLKGFLFLMKIFLSAMAIYETAKELLFVCKNEDSESLKRFQMLCKLILSNLENEADAKV